MKTPKFIHTELESLEELSTEPSYYEKIKEVKGQEKLLKETKICASENDAESYIRKAPGRRNDSLAEFIPTTEYIIGNNPDGEGVIVYTYTTKINGKRLDAIDPNSYDEKVVNQLDGFIAGSLEIFEQEGICPGISLRNFMIDGENRLWYVDSEPYPQNGHEPFELAHAREQRLTKMFGEEYAEKFPRTFEWIEKHKVDDYKKARSKALRNRRRNKQVV